MNKDLERMKKSHYTAMAFLGVPTPDVETQEAIAHVETIVTALEVIATKLLVGCFTDEDSYSNYAMAIIVSGDEEMKKNMMTETEYNTVREGIRRVREKYERDN